MRGVSIRPTLCGVIGKIQHKHPRPLDDLPYRPAVRRWAAATVRELQASLPRRTPSGRRLLAIFVDGLGASTLARSEAMPFLRSMRDARGMRETRAFSGMPSTTTAFQAGFFYGLRHPDVPAFNWLERGSWKPVRMNVPKEAAVIEERIRNRAGDGLMKGGSSYLSILRGGAGDLLNTAGVARVLRARELPDLRLEELPAMADLHSQTALWVLFRLATETAPWLWRSMRFSRRVGSRRHEFNYLLNQVLVGTLLKEVAQAQAILDLVAGVPRIFLTFHDYDESSHRRGPGEAELGLQRIDRGIEMVCAVASMLPDPPDVYVFADHGQIPSTPFEKRNGMTIEQWTRGDGGLPSPALPDEALRVLRPEPPPPTEPPAHAVDCGNYAHVYFGDEPMQAREIASRHPRALARLLACPDVGLALMRHGDSCIAFADGRIVDASNLPPAVSPRAFEAICEELPRSPSSGDVLLYGAWNDGGCITFSWEFGSHGGPSQLETETFLIHPADPPFDPSRIAHGADFHAAFAPSYGGER